MQIDGGCHCGKVHYQADIDTNKTLICHCTDCQTMGGSAFRTVVLVNEDKLQLQGYIKDYIKTADSGNSRAQGFCPECGTHIYATSVGDAPKVYGVRLGTANQRDQISPKMEIWCDSTQNWLGDIEGTKKFPKQPG
ncbi:MAG: GFA family protein [Arenicella sp.]